ncbi:MAG: class I SAM-dependent methyltransferase [Chitinophagaceae bacterium]|nr:class I SAM-dependent methyltransferase [Chitinophagaceae bacterium]
MNALFLMKEYLHYLLKARGVGNMHSPFVYDFMVRVLNDKRHFYAYDEIETLRNRLLLQKEEIDITDYGTGATATTTSQRTISYLLKTSAKPPRQAQLLFRIAVFYQCRQILELGTSLGFSAMYLAASGANTKVITLEGAPALAERARKNFEAPGMKNIEVMAGPFEKTLPLALQQTQKVDLIFFDGNHRKEPTLNYFRQALDYTNDDSIFIFDDIHWSPEMKAAWISIKAHPQVTLTIDLFFFGIVFFRKQLSKQNFVLRF